MCAMANEEINIPTDVEHKIDRIMEDEDFLNREEALQAIIRAGVTAFETDNSPEDEYGGDYGDEMMDNGSHDDEYAF